MKQHSHSITLIVHAINYARYGYVPYQVYTGIKYTRAAGAFPPSLAISIVDSFLESEKAIIFVLYAVPL